MRKTIKLSDWILNKLGHRKFVLLVSLLIGIISGLVAVLLKTVVHFTGNFLISTINKGGFHYLYLALPFIGIMLTLLFVKYIIKDSIGHGVSKILFAISKKSSRISPHNNFSSLIGSVFTVGFGGSVGLEAPIVLTGSSIGSTMGRLFRQNYKTTTLFIGCGAAGAIAGIFKAPIAATVFALEVLMLDLTVWSIIPLLISAVTGATVSYFLLGEKLVFSFSIVEPFVLQSLPFYVVLGVVAGLVSWYFTRGVGVIEDQLGRIKNIWYRLLIGGGVLGLLIFLFPPLFGEGYDTLKSVLGGDPFELTNESVFRPLQENSTYFLLFVVLLIIFKVVATAFTTGSGGVGGVFAPSLFLGGITGYLFAKVANIFPLFNLSQRNFALVGMAGVMAGVMHAPLTAIFLIAEITGGYGLFIPLIVTATVAYLTSLYFDPHSLYTYRLAKRGELITHHKDKTVLKLLNIKRVIEKDLKTVHPDDSLGQLVKVISQSKRNIFPVIDEENNLLGIVSMDEIRHKMFDSELYESTFVKDLMVVPVAFVALNDTMEIVMNKFEETGAWNLPVMNDGKYIGFISKSKVFTSYRKLLVEVSDE